MRMWYTVLFTGSSCYRFCWWNNQYWNPIWHAILEKVIISNVACKSDSDLKTHHTLHLHVPAMGNWHYHKVLNFTQIQIQEFFDPFRVNWLHTDSIWVHIYSAPIILISINATPKYVHWGGAVGVTTMSSLVAPRVVLVTAFGATGRCGVVTQTAPLCSSVYTLGILIVLVSINACPK